MTVTLTFPLLFLQLLYDRGVNQGFLHLHLSAVPGTSRRTLLLMPRELHPLPCLLTTAMGKD